MIFDRDKIGKEESLHDILKSIAMFEDLSEEHLNKVIEVAERKKIARGELLINQGDDAEDFFIVLRGKFNVMTRKARIAEITAGEPVGEIAFFAGGTRTADVVAARECDVLMFSRQSYEKVSNDVPEIAYGIIAALARRVASANPGVAKTVRKTGRNVVLVATNDDVIPAFFDTMIKELLNESSNWEIVDETHIPPESRNASSAELSSWLASQERKGKHILMVCKAPIANRNWADAIMTNCDYLFVVGQSAVAKDGPVPLSSFEKDLFENDKNKEIQLLLWRPDKAQRPQFTGNWLKARRVKMHHHVALDSKDDFERAVSFIQGKSLDIIF